MAILQQYKPLPSGFNLSLADRKWAKTYVPKSRAWEWRYLGPYALLSSGVYRYHRWALMGTYHGYPLCCIRFFIAGRPFDNTEQHNASFELFEGAGFVPCPSCTEKGREMVLQVIESQRMEPHPFPDNEIDLSEGTDEAWRRFEYKVYSQTTIKKLKDRIRNQGLGRFSINDFRVKIADMKDIT